MSVDLSPLLAHAFFVERVQNATEAIERALEQFDQMTHVGALPFEILVPADPDEDWVREQLVAPLVYFCESEGMPMPTCTGTVVAMYVGAQLYVIRSEDVIRWAIALLGTSADQLRTQYGTHEVDTALR